MTPILQRLWSNNISAWKILWLGIAYYIVFSFLIFFIFSLFINDLYIAQFSGHINIYTYFLTDSEKTLLSDPAIIEFAKEISSSFGEFYKSIAEYSLISSANKSTVLFLGFYNFFIFIFWLWWCISIWRNSKNTDSSFVSGFVKFVALNLIIYPMYYFILSFMFLNAGSYGGTTIKEVEEIKTSEIGNKLNITYSNVEFTTPISWEFMKKTEETIVLKKCLDIEKQCGYMIIKKIDEKNLTTSIEDNEKWIKYLNPTHEILSKKILSFKNKNITYFNYTNVYRAIESEVKMIAFNSNNYTYIIEWVSPNNSKIKFFKDFNEIFQSINFID